MALEDERTRSMASFAHPPGQPRLVIVWEGGMITKALEAGKSFSVGRAPDCDLQILHPTVSRHHATIHSGPPVRVEDLGGTHGTRIDGELVGRAGCIVRPGQWIEIGAALLLVQAYADPNSQPASPKVTGEGASNPSPDLDRFISLIARSHLTVLIVGETGSGKEVMAERIHAGSPRRSGPFVRLNCAAFPETLLESELFGYEKGAFTGATHTKLGLIESANGGTLLLDEVGEMPVNTQAVLLRVLETRQVQRVGSVEPFSVDVRILSATNCDLDARVSEGRFRRDLLFRLNGVTIKVPPLRRRRHELIGLAKELLRRASHASGVNCPALSPKAEATLLEHSWPGNIRELRNVIERALVLSEADTIEAHHLLLGESSDDDAARSLPKKLDSYEREEIVQALASAKGNQTRAASMLGMSRRALINRLDAYGLPRPRKQV